MWWMMGLLLWQAFLFCINNGLFIVTGMISVGTHFLFMGWDQDYNTQITLDFCGERFHFKHHQLSLWIKLLEDELFGYLANWDETKLTLYLCFKKHFVNPSGDMTPYLYQCVSLKQWTRLMVWSIDSCVRCGELTKCFLKHRYDVSLVSSQLAN